MIEIITSNNRHECGYYCSYRGYILPACGISLDAKVFIS